MKKEIQELEDKIYIKFEDSQGRLHRHKKTAVFLYQDGKILNIEYRKHGKLHREDGPAIILYDKNSNIIAQEYWLDGKEYDILEYYIILNEQKDVK